MYDLTFSMHEHIHTYISWEYEYEDSTLLIRNLLFIINNLFLFLPSWC